MEMGNVYLALANALFMAGVTLRHKRINSSREFALGLSLAMLLGGLIGARLLYIVLYDVPWREGLSLLSAHRGGFTIVGAILGASMTLLIFARLARRSALMLGGEIVPVWCFASIFWRMRCHFSGCCHGSATNSPLMLWLGGISQSGAPGQIPFPAMEMLFLLALSIWLGPGITMLTQRRNMGMEKGHKLGVFSYFIAYGLFRVIILLWH